MFIQKNPASASVLVQHVLSACGRVAGQELTACPFIASVWVA